MLRLESSAFLFPFAILISAPKLSTPMFLSTVLVFRLSTLASAVPIPKLGSFALLSIIPMPGPKLFTLLFAISVSESRLSVLLFLSTIYMPKLLAFASIIFMTRLELFPLLFFYIIFSTNINACSRKIKIRSVGRNI